MKRIFWISALCLAFVTVMPVIAEDTDKPGYLNSPYYYVNVPIERIYAYRQGYIVDYQIGSTGSLDRVYIPLDWFQKDQKDPDKTGKPNQGEVILLGSGNSWPYLTVYYTEAGEFSHVRLYIRRERSHHSWGVIPAGLNLDEHFQDVDLKLKF